MHALKLDVSSIWRFWTLQDSILSDVHDNTSLYLYAHRTKVHDFLGMTELSVLNEILRRLCVFTLLQATVKLKLNQHHV